MPGPPQPDPPTGLSLVTVDQLCEATACTDCNSELRLFPVVIPLPVGSATQLFGVYIAHDDTCPAMAAATRERNP